MSTSDLAKNLAKELGDTYRQNPLVSYEEHEKKHQNEIEGAVDQLLADFAVGMHAIYDVADEAIIALDSKIELPSLQELSDRLIKISKKQRFGDDANIRDLLGLSDDALGVMFAACHLLQNQGRIVQAGKAFLALATLLPQVGDFWVGLGVSLELQGKKEEAQDAFHIASSLTKT